jgi:DNA repair exonuclease SbcCD nuclease subunit
MDTRKGIAAMKTKITTDWHIGIKRVGGTTPESQSALRQYLRNSLQVQLEHNDHLIAGDLFNDFTIDTLDLLETYRIFSAWLSWPRMPNAAL